MAYLDMGHPCNKGRNGEPVGLKARADLWDSIQGSKGIVEGSPFLVLKSGKNPCLQAKRDLLRGSLRVSDYFPCMFSNTQRHRITRQYSTGTLPTPSPPAEMSQVDAQGTCDELWAGVGKEVVSTSQLKTGRQLTTLIRPHLMPSESSSLTLLSGAASSLGVATTGIADQLRAARMPTPVASEATFFTTATASATSYTAWGL